MKRAYAWSPDGDVAAISPSRGAFFGQPCVRPDGGAVVFWGQSDLDAPAVWLWESGRGQARCLTPTGAAWMQPAYSWDGGRLVVSAAVDAGGRVRDLEGWMSDEVRLQLLVLDLGTATLTEITPGDSRDERAAFDPTGERVVFVSNRGGTRGLWVVPINAGLAAALVYEQPTAYRPWFAADGESVFFFQRIGDRDQICRVGVDGTRFTSLINDDRGISHGPWADPDGETLLMHSNRDGLWGIYELPLAGGPPERLDPPGFDSAAHATRGKNGLIAFDA